jgi:hypothetical protein
MNPISGKRFNKITFPTCKFDSQKLKMIKASIKMHFKRIVSDFQAASGQLDFMNTCSNVEAAED